MAFKSRFKSAGLIALAILMGIIFIPPLFASKLDGWIAAERLLRSDQSLKMHCGGEGSIELSRWLYTYRLSGENGRSRFRGKIFNASCERKFVVDLKKESGEWQVVKLEMQQ